MSRGQYPSTRMRRNRIRHSRRLVAETHLDTADLIWPLFVIEEIILLSRLTPCLAYRAIRLTGCWISGDGVELTIPAIAIFPSINAALKDDKGSLGDGDNLVCRAGGQSKPPILI